MIILAVAMLAGAVYIEYKATVTVHDDGMFTNDGRGYVLVNGDMYRLAKPWDLSAVVPVGRLKK